MTKETKSSIKKRSGFVIRTASPKTIVIEYDITKKHKVYGKSFRLKKRLMAHDEKSKAKIGDKVEVKETRPISKNKRWILSEILQK